MGRILTVIIILLVILGIYYLVRGDATKTYNPAPVGTTTNNDGNGTTTNPLGTGTATSSAQSAMTVTYTDSGFSPKTITIQRGGKVTFINRSSGSMWIASDPHPIHTNYPGFDEKASVGSGGSWTFTFDKTGSWGYHNHMAASNTATVVVK